MCEDGRHRKGILHLIQTLEVGYKPPIVPAGFKGYKFMTTIIPGAAAPIL